MSCICLLELERLLVLWVTRVSLSFTFMAALLSGPVAEDPLGMLDDEQGTAQ